MPLCRKIFYLNLNYKFNKISGTTKAHFDVLRMIISALRRFGLLSKFGRLLSASWRLMAIGGSLPPLIAFHRPLIF